MALQKMHITARFVEEVIDFFMKRYKIYWDPPYKLSKDSVGIPKHFTREFGETAFSFSQIHHYSKIVEGSNINQYFANEATFYLCVHSKAKELLTKQFGFFHMCAFTAEVAVFCQIQSHSKLHASLIAAIMCLGNEINYDKNAICLSDHQQEVKNSDNGMPERKLKENDVELTSEISQTVSNDLNAKAVGGNGPFTDTFANNIDLQLHQSRSENCGNFQILRLEPPYYIGPQYAQTSLPGYSQRNVPEASVPIYPIYHGLQFGCPPVSNISWNGIEQNNIVNYFQPNFASGASMTNGDYSKQ